MRWAIVLMLLGISVAGAEERQRVTLNGHTFTIPAGFSLELVAKSPLVDRPIVASVDGQGRLFVADSSGTNERPDVQLKNPTHRIICLEDTNRDGVYDKSTVFADKMMFPEGVLCYEGSIFVAAPPHIWKLTDTNNDGKADKREIWYDGGTVTGCANDLHGPYLGPDGYIYWCKGAFAKQTHRLPNGKTLTTRASHIFRAKPDGTGREPVMTGGMDNPVDVAFLPNGERFFTTTFFQHPGNGQRDGLIHAIYGGIYGKEHDVIDDPDHQWTSPQVMPVMTHLGPAAPSGLHCITSTALGYQHQLVAAQFNMRKISRHILKPKGSTYETEDHDLVVAESTDFHPTDVLEDRDGSLLIIDTGGWYKMCCPSSQLVKADVLGAIYRLRRTDKSTAVPAANDFAAQFAIHQNGLRRDRQAIPQLLAALKSDNLITRRLAAEALGRISDASVVPAILDALTQKPDRVLEHALTYALIEIGNEEALTNALTKSDVTVRRCVMIARDQLGMTNPVNLLLAAINSSDANTQEAAWWVISRHPERAQQVAPLIRDRLTDNRLKPAEWIALAQRISKLAKTPVIQQQLADLVLTAPPAMVRERILPLMRQAGVRELPPAWATALQTAISKPESELTPSLLVTTRQLPPPKTEIAKWNTTLEQLARTSQQATTQLLAMLNLIGSPRALSDAEVKLVLEQLSGADLGNRSLAADMIAKTKWTDDQLHRLSRVLPKVGLSERERVLSAFQQSTNLSVGQALLQIMSTPGWRSTLRVEQVRGAFAKYPPELKANAEKLCEELNQELKQQTANLDALIKRLPTGDIRRGQAVFNSQKTQCIACHNIGYVGGKIGPDLTRIGSIRTERDLLESIVYPSASFVRSYEPITVRTHDGKVFNGVLKKDSADEVVLTLSADKETRIDRKEIEEMVPGKVSIMPAGLNQQMTEQDLADLLAFLRDRR